MKTIKVRVDVTVEVDVDAYRAAYGAESIPKIREDVRAAVADAINSGAVLADGIVGVGVHS